MYCKPPSTEEYLSASMLNMKEKALGSSISKEVWNVRKSLESTFVVDLALLFLCVQCARAMDDSFVKDQITISIIQCLFYTARILSSANKRQ